MGCLWSACEVLMGSLRSSYELLRTSLWSAHAVLMKCLWGFYEVLMMSLWSAYEVLMRSLWSAYALLMKCLWDVYELLMGCLWSAYEVFYEMLMKRRVWFWIGGHKKNQGPSVPSGPPYITNIYIWPIFIWLRNTDSHLVASWDCTRYFLYDFLLNLLWKTHPKSFSWTTPLRCGLGEVLLDPPPEVCDDST